ncbi:sce7725 family protein [Vibrio mediterranei]|nr:sce7725 family protein [Vibrio mediterranei]
MRGKKHELSALRKISSILDPQKVRPIIEPVKSNTTSLIRTITLLNSHQHRPLVIINPIEGELAQSNLLSLLQNPDISFLPCVAFTHNNVTTATQIANQFIQDHVEFSTYFRHEPTANLGHITSQALINSVFSTSNSTHTFLSTLPNLVKIQDCFTASARNADYSILPYNFSDAHLTYQNLPNAIGFGDFQIVGEPFSSSGGPARAVAIHITYINSQANDLMYIKHSVSTIDSNTTTNTGAKCIEALQSLVSFANQTPDINQQTIGFTELLDYHTRRHFPNLGPIKECSMMHHIETLNSYL